MPLGVQHVPFISEHPAQRGELAIDQAPLEIIPGAEIFQTVFQARAGGANKGLTICNSAYTRESSLRLVEGSLCLDYPFGKAAETHAWLNCLFR
jgi:hypothetical protein